MQKHPAYKADPRPLHGQCGCYTCRNFSRAYLRHLFLAGKSLYGTLATIHNLLYYLDTMREMREAILSGTFPKYLDVVRASAAPSSSDPARTSTFQN